MLETFYRETDAKVAKVNAAIDELKQIHSLLFPSSSAENQPHPPLQPHPHPHHSKFRRFKERLRLLQREVYVLESINRLMMKIVRLIFS